MPMLDNLPQLLNHLGSRIQNYGYLLANPSYERVRAGRGCADLYRLLNKRWFPKNTIQLVLDVGANEGQFIKTCLALLPGVPIYAFEPNPSAVACLKTTEWGGAVTVFPIALGSQPETLALHISQFSPASSLLPTSAQLAAEFPETAIASTVDVPVERLDSVIQRQDWGAALPPNQLLLKIDVQGFELEVLKGATGIFDRITAIVCEVNLALLYEQQCTLDAILSFLQHHHYRLVDMSNPVRSRFNDEILYVDLAFLRNTELTPH